MAYHSVVVLYMMLLAVHPARPEADWGFFGHRLVCRLAVYSLPGEMYPFFRNNIGLLSAQSVKPDQRRYAVPWEGQRHFLDMDAYPDTVLSLWKKDPSRADSIPQEFRAEHGELPRQVLIHMKMLTRAMMDHDSERIIRLAAELSHYVSDAHVPLHTTENYDGQYTGQSGIHGLWESRLPELLFTEYDLFTRKAEYIDDAHSAIWNVLEESHGLVDSVLHLERKVAAGFGQRIMTYDQRGKAILRQYSPEFARSYDRALGGMVERRLRQSAELTADLWYTSWVNAGLPDLTVSQGTAQEADSADIIHRSDYGGKRSMIHG